MGRVRFAINSGKIFEIIPMLNKINKIQNVEQRYEGELNIKFHIILMNYNGCHEKMCTLGLNIEKLCKKGFKKLSELPKVFKLLNP